jgi:hypothetical protein
MPILEDMREDALIKLVLKMKKAIRQVPGPQLEVLPKRLLILL